MMAEPLLEIRGFAIIPPREQWGDDQRRFELLSTCYESFHIPIRGFVANARAIVDWDVLGDQKRWRVAHLLSKHFYPHATPPMVYQRGFSGDILLSSEKVTFYTESPLPDQIMQ